MATRPYNPETDYSTLCRWWAAHGWAPVPAGMLAAQGFVVDEIAAGFIYGSDSGIAWLEWIVTAPDSAPEARGKALDELMDVVETNARERGFGAIFTSSNHPRLIERYESKGFVKTDSTVTHLIKRIG